jgi:hypothetical protein
MSSGPGLESLVDRKQILDKPFLLFMCFTYINTYKKKNVFHVYNNL